MLQGQGELCLLAEEKAVRFYFTCVVANLVQNQGLSQVFVPTCEAQRNQIGVEGRDGDRLICLPVCFT